MGTEMSFKLQVLTTGGLWVDLPGWDDIPSYEEAAAYGRDADDRGDFGTSSGEWRVVEDHAVTR